MPLSASAADQDAPMIKCDPQISATLKPHQKLLHVKGMVCAFCVQGIEKRCPLMLFYKRQI
jgi:hypothetical protein